MSKQQEYVAHCVEHGEFFITTFNSEETNPEKLLEIGRELASEWGGECYSVETAEEAGLEEA